MKLYKNKIQRIINFIKYENKFKRCDLVEVLSNTSKYKEYDKYIGQIAIVTNMDYEKEDYVVGLKFLDGKEFDFKVCELKKCDEVIHYKELKELMKTI